MNLFWPNKHWHHHMNHRSCFELRMHPILLLSILLLLGEASARLLEHNFSRPWLNANGELQYENLSSLWKIMDEILPKNTLPESVRRRESSSGCNSFEIHQCGDPSACWLNSLPDNPLDMYAITTPSNRAHYRCKCKHSRVSIDYLEVHSESNDTVANSSRIIQTKCPQSPPCDKCDREHTIKCLDMGGGRAMCICDPDYMEDQNCARKKDGCTEPHPAATLTGNQACLVDVTTNNTCYPVPQSLKYSCLCREPFREDRRLSFPNCMDNRTVCPSRLCLGFQPPPAHTIPGPSIELDDMYGMGYGVGSSDHNDCNQTVCDCPDGWLGPHCSETRGETVLGSWSPWSACSPDCILPNERSRYTRLEDFHAGNSRATAVGYRSRFSRCTVSDLDYCVGTYRFWRRCRVTTLCNSWVNSRLSTVVNEAIGKAMTEHDKVHRPDRVEPVLTVAAELTSYEKHCLNFIVVAGTLIFSCISIWLMEIDHMLLHWNDVRT